MDIAEFNQILNNGIESEDGLFDDLAKSFLQAPYFDEISLALAHQIAANSGGICQAFELVFSFQHCDSCACVDQKVQNLRIVRKLHHDLFKEY